jgi:putative thioredoxin
MVFAFFQGQPVTAFAGARPASDIKTLITQLVAMAEQAKPEALDIPAVLEQAALFAAEGRLGDAQQLYMAVLGQDESNIQAYGGLVRTLIAAEAMEEARGMIDHASDAIKASAGFAAIRASVDLAEKRPDAEGFAKLRAAVEKEPGNHQARFDLAVAEFAAGERVAAIDHLLEIIRKERAWDDEKARKQLLQFFDAMGPMDPETMAGRRKLSSLLFS